MTETPEPGVQGRWSWPRCAVAILFFAGLGFRLVVFYEPHVETDELIYKTLVQQLDQGEGYTLHGTPLLEFLDKQVYDRPLFFHPPGGTALFWAASRLLGDSGYPLTQLLAYVVFFWSMLWLAAPIGITSSRVALPLLAGLAAFNPIMAHVTTNHWLDGPVLAFTTLAAAAFVHAVVRNRAAWAAAAGVVLGCASLVKVTAFFPVPGLLALGWTLGSVPRRRFLWLGLCLLVPAALIQLPWEIWQWLVFGTPFPGSTPPEALLETNKYVYFLTVVRSPWSYLSLLPRILWTLVPSILLFSLFFRLDRIKWPGLCCLLWMAAVITPHVVLGAQGYGKVVRYVILVVPAALILSSLVIPELFTRLQKREYTGVGRSLAWVLLVVALLACVLEIAAGVASSMRHDWDLIVPFVGGP